MCNSVYSKEELFSAGRQRTYDRNAREAAFLLGGIGTGNVSIGSRGEFRDWEIFNKPGKGNILPYAFFAIWAREEGTKPLTRVLESELIPPFSKSHGFGSGETAGLPRFQESEMKGEYPLASVRLKDADMPVEVVLDAFTPFIPLNADDSGIPCAILKYRVKNLSSKKVDFTIAGSLSNMAGFNGYNEWGNLNEEFFNGNVNEFRKGDGFSGLYLYSTHLGNSHLKYGNMSLVTTAKNTTAKPTWYIGRWFDGIQDMWDDFSSDGRFEYESNTGFEPSDHLMRSGSIGVCDELNPGEEKEVLFLLTWYFPNRLNGWSQECCGTACECKMTQNYYTNLFNSSWNAAEYAIKNYDRLYAGTLSFHDALFGSSLPDYVLDAAASNITVLRSTTCFRLKDGKFFGWEGCFGNKGCCEGNCTHVWNYEQTLAFLFPSLERDMRITEFNVETENNGKMEFRTKKLFGESNNFHPAADGQLGCIIRLYRDWKLSGDNAFLSEVWDNARKALDFAFTYWDSDGDFVLDSQQHNTYDIEFYGPNSLTNSMFYGALKAGSEMAEAIGDTDSSTRYRKALQIGSERMDKMLWEGDYYIQVIDDVNKYKYQYGKGCLSDQLLGQLASHVAGLGYVLPEDHVKRAVYSIFKNNFFADFSQHSNVQRTYALNDEKGLVLCSWPNGGRPVFPFVYSDEVWTGIEYQVAAHLIYEGFIEEGLTIVRAVRDRHDGIRRNPWNEVECGNHYARSMASWAVITALSGYKYDLVNGVIEFNPVTNKENFSCFFSCDKAWGVFTRKLDKDSGEYESDIDVLYGSLEGVEVKVGGKSI
jgi:non-lysosomal glucosylceramidase